MKFRVFFLIVFILFFCRLFSQHNADLGITVKSIKSDESLDIQNLIDNLHNKDIVSLNLYFTDIDRDKNKWIDYFNSLKISTLIPFEFNIFTFPEKDNKYPKFHGIREDHIISHASLFILQHADFNLETLNDKYNKVKFEVINSQSNYELVRVSKIIDTTASPNSCGPIQYDLFQEPISEYINRYSLFYLNTQVDNLKVNSKKSEQTFDSLLNIQNEKIKLLEEGNKFKKHKLAVLYSKNASRLNFGNSAFDVSEVKNNLFSVNIRSAILDKKSRLSLIWGLSMGSASFKVRASNFTTEYQSASNNNEQYIRKTFYSNWQENVLVDYLEVPLAFQYRITDFKALNVAIGSGFSLFYLQSFNSFINSGSYSVRGKLSGIKDYLEDIPELNLYSNDNVSNMQLFNRGRAFSIAWNASLNLSYAITDEFSIESAFSYNAYPNLLKLNENKDVLTVENKDIESVLEQSNAFSLPRFNIGLGLVLNIK